MAAQQGVFAEKIISAIEHSIADAITTAQRESNFEVLERWGKIPCAGSIPTAAELLAYLGEQGNS